MLVLARHEGEEIVIGNDVRVVVVEIRSKTVRLGIVAPKDLPVDRLEIRQRKDLEIAREVK